MAAASDVPARYDLVLSGGSLSAPVGFVFLDALEPSLPFRTHRAIYGYSPTFIERANTSGSFGDNQQDFFLTSTQRDWSLGEQQRYARVNDADSARRYWQGSGVDVRIPGQASMRAAITSLTYGQAVVACGPPFILSGSSQLFIPVAGGTNLYTTADDGTIVDRGAHGLTAQPAQWGVASDTNNAYLTSTLAGSVGVRKWRGDGGGFSTFSASPADSIAFLNNTLYGLRHTSGDLIRWDTAGTLTSIFTWKGADGAVVGLGNSKAVPYGGKLAILRLPTRTASPPAGTGIAELWTYDGGAAPSLALQLPPGFVGYDVCVAEGTIFVSGNMPMASGSSAALCPVIFYYANGTFGMLWRGYSATGVGPPMVAWNNGLLFADPGRSALMYWNPDTGGVHTLSTAFPVTSNPVMGASGIFAVALNSATSAYGFKDSGSAASSATVTTSLADFDSSLTKFFRGITVDFDSATDGNGGTVDIAYRVNDVDGSYTSLQTGATSGTEYILTGITGRSISAKITLNKGTSTGGPVLKRVSFRAAPILTSYRTGEYVLDCTGDGGKSPRTLRDATPNPLAGFESLAQLQIAKASLTPLTVTDRTGTYTGIVEQLEAYEEHPGLDDPTRSGEFVVKLIMRGI